MVSTRFICGLSTVVALVNGQAIIQKAVGAKGTSKSLLVKQGDAKDANIIKQAEILTNIVNECGRTLLGGNIDIGEQTEIELAAGSVTQSTKGGKLTVTINQVNAQGSGPFECDLDLTGNANAAIGQTKLTVKQNKADFGNGVMNLEVDLPANMACIGASTGDVCTVRCRNAQEFGGCFAVQQTDTKASKNVAGKIVTASTLDQVNKQVAVDQKDFEVSVNAIAGSKLADQGTAVADALIKNNADALAGGKGNGNGNAGNGNGNAGNGNGNAGNGNGGGRGGGRGGNNAGNGNANAGNGNANAGNGAGAGAGNGNANAGNGAGRGGNGNGNANAGNGNANAGNGNANAGNGNANAGNGAGRGGSNAANGGGNAAAGGNGAGRGGNNNNNRKRSTFAVRRTVA